MRVSAKTRTGSAAGRREKQIVRILGLLRVLRQDPTLTVHELATRFRTRRETIYRDLRVLQDAGYPIAGDERGRLSRPRLIASAVPELRFAPTEVDALLLAAAQAQAALPSAESLSSAIIKLKALAEWPAGLDELFETWACGSKDYRAHEDRIGVLIWSDTVKPWDAWAKKLMPALLVQEGDRRRCFGQQGR